MIPEQRLSTETILGPYIFPYDQEITDVQDWEMGGIAISDTSQGRQYQAWKSSCSPAGVITLHPQETGDPVVIYTKAGIIQHSFSFDQNMRWTLAYTLSDGAIEHVWYNSSIANYELARYDNGEQFPRVCMDDTREFQVTASDNILSYIKNGGLYFRAQRDRYLIEYTLLTGIAPETLLLNMGMNTKWRLQFSVTEKLSPPPYPPPPPAPPAPPTITILVGVPPDGVIGEQYNFPLHVKNGVPVYTWEVEQGLMPPGLTLGDSEITGTPLVPGQFVFRLKVQDAVDNIAYRVLSLKITFN